MSVEELNSTLKQIHDKIERRNPHHLYIPGRVLLTYIPWRFNKDENFINNDTLTVEEKKVDVACDGTSIANHNELQSVHCTVTDGTAPVLRFFEIDGHRMITDHLTASYYASVEALESKYCTSSLS